MHANTTDTWEEVRLRYGSHLRRIRDLMDGHRDYALKATGGRIKAAIPIFSKRVAADGVLRRELQLIEGLDVALGFPPHRVLRPSRNPKRRK